MASFATKARDWLLPVLLGAAAPTVLVGVWGALIATVWLPASRYLWTSHQVKLRDLPLDASSIFDAVIGLLLGILISFGVARFVRNHFLRAWLLFAVSFLVALIGPSIIMGDFDLAGFIFLQPLVLFFAFASAAMFTWRARVGSQQNVP